MDQIFFHSQKMLFLDVFPLKISKKYFFQSFLKNSWNKGLKDWECFLNSPYDKQVRIHLWYGELGASDINYFVFNIYLSNIPSLNLKKFLELSESKICKNQLNFFGKFFYLLSSIFVNLLWRRNFPLVARYSLKFTRCSLLVLKSLVTRCKIHLLLVAEVACSKKWLVTRCTICSLLAAAVARCKKSLVTRYNKSFVTRCKKSFITR